jgi:hypothetical protein
MTEIDHSLRRLGTDYIDLYMIGHKGRRAWRGSIAPKMTSGKNFHYCHRRLMISHVLLPLQCQIPTNRGASDSESVEDSQAVGKSHAPDSVASSSRTFSGQG